jgi:ABC-2 type transport system permease protein
MTAIMRRELSSYFYSPIGYVFLAVFYVFAGFYFFASCLMSNSTELSPVFGAMFTIVLFLIPILTMRLFSEDRKHKTDQALLTAPISLTGLVLGKFLAAFFIYLISLAVLLVDALIVAGFAPPNWQMIFGNFTGLLLLGSALISICMFISSLTENQVIAAIGGFASALGLLLLDSLGGVFQNPVAQQIFTGISFFQRYNDFTSGKFDLAGVFFFLSVCAIFIFLTVRALEKRRWS